MQQYLNDIAPALEYAEWRAPTAEISGIQFAVGISGMPAIRERLPLVAETLGRLRPVRPAQTNDDATRPVSMRLHPLVSRTSSDTLASCIRAGASAGRTGITAVVSLLECLLLNDADLRAALEMRGADPDELAATVGASGG